MENHNQQTAPYLILTPEIMRKCADSPEFEELYSTFIANCPEEFLPESVLGRSEVAHTFCAWLVTEYLRDVKAKVDVDSMTAYKFGLMIGTFMSEVGRSRFVLRE